MGEIRSGFLTMEVPVLLEAATVIARPVAVVWDFYAVHHVENHPRWDPTIQLEASSSRPLGVGTVIGRRVSRFDRTTEGTMEIIEFEPERAMRVRIRDGATTIIGWARFEAVDDDHTRLVIGGEFPGLDDPTREQLHPMIERSAATIRSLIESET